MREREPEPVRWRRVAGAVRQRITGFGLNLLYNELAWLYDLVSWIVSQGRWRQWQRTALLFLPKEGRVLEVGAGSGHVLASLAAAGYRTLGLDLSTPMLRLAQRKLRRSQYDTVLIRGRAEVLPFPSGTFDAIVVTFPTAYVYEEAWLQSAARVLRPRGRLIVVEMASATGQSATDRCIESLYRAAGLSGAAPDLLRMIGSTGLVARQETVALESSTVHLVLAEKPAAQPPARGTPGTGT